MRTQRSTQVAYRSGTTAVEFTMIAPLLFTFVFACIEVGHAMMVIQTLEEAARRGCREAILDDAAEADVKSTVVDFLATGGIPVSTSKVNINPSSLDTSCLWDPITVDVSVLFSNVSWIPVPQILGSVALSGSSTLPREGNPCE